MVFFGSGLPRFVDCLSVMATLFLIFVIFKILEYVSKRTSLTDRSYKFHCWKSSKFTNQVLYCSKCVSQTDEDGSYCMSCGVAACSSCLGAVNKSFRCKDVTAQQNVQMKHHWVQGNIPVGYYCYVCEEDCSSEPGLSDLRCIWCDHTVHTRCKHALAEVCDFGAYRSYIVPPQCVATIPKKSRVQPYTSIQFVQRIDDPGWSEWTPLFALGNSKSGNGRGDEVLCLLRRYLNPIQVIDLCESGSMDAVLRVISMLPSTVTPRLLVAGGDGSVAWLLSGLEPYSEKVHAPVGIIPLGTGNDLARVLGWGSQEPSHLTAEQIFSQMGKTTPVELDRWKVEIRRSLRFGRLARSKHFFMYNYLSVGVDAMVTLKFHNTRKSPFYLFSSRIINKLMYLWFGADQVLDRSCQGLEANIELYLDGVRIQLPSVESIVILNIPSWGAGVPLWHLGQDEEDADEWEGGTEQEIDDGLLEVAAIYSSFHIAQLQVGLSRSHRIGQAKHVKLKLKRNFPMQIDGEPWMEGPGEIVVSLHNKASVLKLND